MEEKLKKILEDHEKRILRLEKTINKPRTEVTKEKVEKNQKQNYYSAPTGGVRFLVSNGFFKQRRIFTEVKKELQSNNYNHSRQSINRTLNSLSKHDGPLVALKEGKLKEYADRK